MTHLAISAPAGTARRPGLFAATAVAAMLITLAGCGGGSGMGGDENLPPLESLSASDKAILDAALESGEFDEELAAEKRYLYTYWSRMMAQKRRSSGGTTSGTTGGSGSSSAGSGSSGSETSGSGSTSSGSTSSGSTSSGSTSSGSSSSGSETSGSGSGSGTSTGSTASPSVPQSALLLQKSDLVYVGAFRVPQGSSDTTTFNYGGTALGLGQGGQSLFMTGHDWHQRSAELSIPQVVNNGNITGLATASLVQSFADPTEGRLGQINPSDSNAKKVGGHLVYNGQLYVTGWSYYDGAGTQSASHFRRPVRLSTTGQVVGPVRVGSQYPGYVHGFMATIPPEWRAAFGGPALTGHGGASIASIQSNGPAASVFDPERIGSGGQVPATALVGYPLAQSLARQYGANESGAANPYWSVTSSVDGAVFPVGTRSVLFFGRHGTGAYCYGTGGASGGDCHDPADTSKGSHAYPYAYQVWAYDANDLLAVKSGSKAQHQVRPYSVWTFELPYAVGSRKLGGVAYDSETGRIYISQLCADSNCAPVIHVMRVAK